MLAGLPITERVLDVGGVETTVLESGNGPSLVLLHGGIECGRRVLGAGDRSPRRAPPAGRTRRPGARRVPPVHRLDDDTFAAWFTGVLEQTHAEQPTLVAHSLLGSAAARFAARRSDLLGGLVVYGAPGVGPYRMPMCLRYVAIRFGIRPSARNAERFDRFALLISTRCAGAIPIGWRRSTSTRARTRDRFAREADDAQAHLC